MANIQEEVVRPREDGPRYKCCDHCGINFPSVGESYCEKNPDTHLVMCGEPGCELGKTEVKS